MNRLRWCWVLGALLLAPGGAGDAAGPSAGGADALLERLLVEYRAHGLPLPPKGARLVRYQWGGGALVNGKVEPPTYSIAILVKDGKGKAPARLLRGDGFESAKPSSLKPVEPRPAALKGVNLEPDECLLMAVQCRSLGWNDLARQLLVKRSKSAGAPEREALLRVAWDHWRWKITAANSDRALIARRLKALRASDRSLDKEYHRALIRSLEAALVPSRAKPGSVEALIDGLVDYTGRTGTDGWFQPRDRYWELVLRGFEAVPKLIEHLEDDRLTRGVMTGFNNFPSWHLRVEHVVSDVLEDLAGERLGRDWLRRQQGYPVKKADALKWWREASKMSEEAYLLAHVLPKGGSDANGAMLRLLQAKYPRHIPRLYRTVLDKHPRMESSSLAEAVARSALPREEKVKLLRYGAAHKDLAHRRPALWQLVKLDKPHFARVVLQTLKEMPKDVKGSYWTCEEAAFALFVPLADDPQVWRALETAARRASVGLRMELLGNVTRFGSERPEVRRRQLAFLAAFLDDAAGRDITAEPKKYDGPCGGFHYDRLAVRDLAAMEMAMLLGIKVKLDPDRTAAEWAALRAKVRAAWKREVVEPKPRRSGPDEGEG